MKIKKSKLIYQGDVEFDEREFNGHLIGIAEDPARNMMRSDGTSEQYIIYVKTKHGRKDKCYITRLGCKKYGCENAKELALDIFYEPEKYSNILGENWRGYEPAQNIPKKAVQA